MSHGADYCSVCYGDIYLLEPENGGCACSGHKTPYEKTEEKMIKPMKLSQSEAALKEMIEAFYKQKPRPKTAVVFKMKLKAAVDYCKDHGIELPQYEKAIKEYKKSESLYDLFKQLYPNYSLPYICRELNIDSDQYYNFQKRFRGRE